MNKNDHIKKYYELPVGVVNVLLKDYQEKTKLLNDADKVAAAETMDTESALPPLMYAFTCGQLSIYELILHGSLGVLKDEDLYHSKIIKEKTDA